MIDIETDKENTWNANNQWGGYDIAWNREQQERESAERPSPRKKDTGARTAACLKPMDQGEVDVV